MATPSITLEVGARAVRVTNPEKAYFPDAGLTKLDLTVSDRNRRAEARSARRSSTPDTSTFGSSNGI